MALQNESKINQLMREWPSSAIYLSKWMKENGFSDQLISWYKKSGWIEPIGAGAFVRKGSEFNWFSAVYALQQQAGIRLHPGGRAALALQGQSHYLELGQQQVILFGPLGTHLPKWFRDYHWNAKVNLITTSFLPVGLGLVPVKENSFEIEVSSPARAIMECLYLAPERFDLVECYQLMEGLNNPRPDEVSHLLEYCSSVKVKRLFLYMAEKAGHSWLDYINRGFIDLGKGKRHLVKDGVYIAKYGITVPKEIASS